MKLTQYEKYKGSGIEWLGTIPEHWNTPRFKDFAKKIVDGTHFTPDYKDYGVNFLSVNDITRKQFDINQSKFISIEEHKQLYKRCNPVKGDILLSKNGTIGIPFIIDFDIQVSIYVSLCLIKIKQVVYNKYFYYILLSDFMFEQYKINAKTNSVSNLHLDKLANFYSILPPTFEEQTAIANYLDQKTTAIDRKIDLLEKKIDRYQALRKSLINETVCRGLDKSVKLKESGIEWIGQVPEHWEVKRLKELSRIINGSTPQSNNAEFWDGDINWITPAEFGKEKFIFESKRKITKKGLASCGTFLIPIGTVIISSRAPIGSLAIAGAKVCTNQGCKSIIPKSIKTLFLYYFLSLQENILNAMGNGTTFKELSTGNLNNLFIPTPPLSEQTTIDTYLDEKTQKIDTIISHIKKQIEVLKELRKTLINDVVTGKIRIDN